jgi:hypothetical protein
VGETGEKDILMELNWDDHREQLDAQLRWQQVRKDFYGNICYEQKNCAARERAINNGHIRGPAKSLESYTGKHKEHETEVMSSHQFYYTVVCQLDEKIKQASRDGDAIAHFLLLIEANDVVAKMRGMTYLSITHREIIKNPSAVDKTAISTEQKSAAARSTGAKGGLPSKTPSAIE